MKALDWIQKVGREHNIHLFLKDMEDYAAFINQESQEKIKKLENDIKGLTVLLGEERNLNLAQHHNICNLEQVLDNEWLQYPENTPANYGRYEIYRQGCNKQHYLTWNGVTWSSDGNTVTHFRAIEKPKIEFNENLVKSSEVNPTKTKEQEMEEFFLEKLNSCEKVVNEKFPDSVFFKCQDKVLFEQDNKNKYFWVRYNNVWSVFEDRFKLYYKDTQKFIRGMVEKHLKLDGFTTEQFISIYMELVEKHLKLDGFTTIIELLS